MKITCTALTDVELANVRKEISEIQRIVQTATGDLAARIRTRAPKKSGDLIKGIIPSPWEENSAYPGKIVREVYMDAGMNDTFVKVSKAGKRYYYPASQEFGFKIPKRKNIPQRDERQYKRRNRVPGKFFMNDTFVEYGSTFEENVDQFVEKVVKNG